MIKHVNCIHLLLFVLIHYLNGTFTPNPNDYDAYGLKVATNKVLLVQAQNANNPPTFFIQFSSYNDNHTSLQCVINYPDIQHNYVYSVAVGKKQNLNETYFFFAGELINDQNGTFIGLAKYNNNSNISNDASQMCNTSFSYTIQYLFNYGHQEYYIIGVEPRGRFAYGFSNRFVFIIDSQNTSTLESWDGNLTWPDDSFMPHAVDITDNFGIIVGFVHNNIDAYAIFSPIIYLLNMNSSNHHPIVIDQYRPNATAGTWQDLLTNADANIYSAKYDMSVSINERGEVLIGMQFINRVFLFSVNVANPIKLNYISRSTNGRSLGNGKGVAWLENGIAAILVNSYSLDYEWSSSQIYFYDIQTSVFNSTSIPLSIFPNNHQILPTRFSEVFLNIFSSPSSLILLDDRGNLLVFIPTVAGFFPSVQDTGSIPLVTSAHVCLPGTYKNQTGIYDCILCPTGTKNPGNSNTYCLPCTSGSFCSLGSVDNISQSALESITQAVAYPKSPESTAFDEVLIQNMFSIRPGRCLLISPLFWTLIVVGLVMIIIIIMGILKFFIKNTQSKRIRRVLKCSLQHTDLISEGESWIGGLASIAVLVLVCFSFAFSNAYLKQYPIETSSDSYFACDLSIRNANFETSLQSLSIPLTYEEQEMFNLLNNQTFYLNIDFINTLINCNAISIQTLFGTTWFTIRWLNCMNNNSILSLSISLPYQYVSVQVLLNDVRTIGALRIGLTGDGRESGGYTLRQLNFSQSFSKNGQLLAQTLSVILDMTKVINETLALMGEKTNFSGIFIPTFAIDSNSLFQSIDQYVRSTIILTTLTVVLSETPYYVKNVQQPIAKQPEIIFHNLLFALVCLEIFGLIFLLYKLVLKPFFYYCFLTHSKQMNGDLKHSYRVDRNYTF